MLMSTVVADNDTRFLHEYLDCRKNHEQWVDLECYKLGFDYRVDQMAYTIAIKKLCPEEPSYEEEERLKHIIYDIHYFVIEASKKRVPGLTHNNFLGTLTYYLTTTDTQRKLDRIVPV